RDRLVTGRANCVRDRARKINVLRSHSKFATCLQGKFHSVGGCAQAQMVVRVWAGDVDRSADDFARVGKRVDGDSGGEAVEEVPPAEVFNCQRRFAFRQNRVSHMVMLSSVVAPPYPTWSFRGSRGA